MVFDAKYLLRAVHVHSKISISYWNCSYVQQVQVELVRSRTNAALVVAFIEPFLSPQCELQTCRITKTSKLIGRISRLKAPRTFLLVYSVYR